MRLLNFLTSWLLAASTGASAAQIAFDCDVPADRFSSVTGSASTPTRIEGVVSVSELRRGSNMPVAGARLVDGDKRKSVGFQLLPKSRGSSEVILNLNDGGGLKRQTVGEVSSNGPVRFSLSISESGAVELKIGEQSFTASAAPLVSPTWMAFCSTGQFKFSELAF